MSVASPSTTPLLDLAGVWSARADPSRVGEAERWFAAPLADAVELRLPGSAQAQGIGSPPDITTEWVGGSREHAFYDDDRYAPYREADGFKIPFWLQPERVYVGAVWYQRDIEIGEGLAARPLSLSLERVHWESTVWVDEQRVGSDRSLTTPHRSVLPALTPGTHRLTVRVDNAMLVDVGPNAHSVSDHTQGGWNGIIGELALRPLDAVRISALAVHPEAATRRIRVRATLETDSLDGAVGTLHLVVRPLTEPGQTTPAPLDLPVEIERAGFTRGRATTARYVDVDYPLGDDARLWDEFDPFVYELTATFTAETGGRLAVDRRSSTFGLRTVEAVGTRIHVNGRPVFLRGTLECAVFPLTGYPATDVESWARIFAACQAYGLNHVRFHSWCPPEAAFRAADAAGVYLQVEGPIWANQGAAIGEGRDVDDFLYAETARILAEFGDHPSFLLMAHGNEPAGRDAEFLGDWIHHWRRRDPRRLYTSSGGWPSIDASDFDCIPEPRMHRWDEGLDSRINAQPPATTADYRAWVQRTPRPIVTHEAGQWCVYPDFDEIEKYTGFMSAKNFEIARDFLEQGGMLHQAADFVHASGRLQVLAYKEEVESALRTPGFGGIQLLGLNDFPGQGTAPVGVMDALWNGKGYTSGEEWSRFFSSTVPLALLSRRTFRASERVTAGVRIAHFGPRETAGEVTWHLIDDAGTVLDRGTTYAGAIALGNEADYGTLSGSLADVTVAQRIRLVITVTAGDTLAENDWELWVYPDAVPASTPDPDAPEPGSGIETTRSLPEALDRLSRGETVLFVPRPDEVTSPVVFGFSPVFWNTSWTHGQPPHTLGVLCDPAHPVFSAFPTDPHTNWQWWELVQQAQALDLSSLASRPQPLVQVIDSWFDARRLGLMLEARVGGGRLLLSTIDLVSDLDDRIVARQLRASVDAYLRSAAFAPQVELTPAEVRGILGGE